PPSGASYIRAHRRPARRAPPPAGIAVRVERLPCASGACRAARRLVWTHRRELTTAIGPRELLQVRVTDRVVRPVEAPRDWWERLLSWPFSDRRSLLRMI